MIKEKIKIELFAVRGNSLRSNSVFANYIKLDKNKKIKLLSTYAQQYAGDGDNTLIDEIRGKKDFRTGEWQGFEGKDFEAIVDLGAIKPINKVGLGCLQDIGSWIWMPKEISFEASDDSVNFKILTTINTDFSDTISIASIKDFTANIMDTKARFIRIKAKTYGIIPQWHKGKGGKSWMFLDEIIIQ